MMHVHTVVIPDARSRWGQDATLDNLTDRQRAELAASLDRPSAA